MQPETEAISVFVRVRPFLGEEDTNCEFVKCDLNNHSVTIAAQPETKTFTYDDVASPDASQSDVYNMVARSVAPCVLKGQDQTIFVYGQTGSGKTFSMHGPSSVTESLDGLDDDNRGILPRILTDIFGMISREERLCEEGEEIKKQFLAKVSYLEIYNEGVYDLLSPVPCTSSLHIRESLKTGVHVENLTEDVVRTAEDAYQLFIRGNANRKVGATSMNRESSRSHSVFTVHVESMEISPNSVAKIRRSKLNLVDLAGSERQKSTDAAGTRLREAGQINKSLATLGSVINALVESAHGKARHIHYRDSKLTFLLRDSFGGSTRTYLCACVSPCYRSINESLSTLKFASRAKTIENKVLTHEECEGDVVALQSEISRLNALIAQQPTSGVAMTTSDTMLHTLYIDGARERDSMLNEINGMKGKIDKLEQLRDKQQKMLQSTQMILKMRENALKRLNTKQPESELVNELRQEITCLNEQLAHNPSQLNFVVQNLDLHDLVSKYESVIDLKELTKTNIEMDKLKTKISSLECALANALEENARLNTKIINTSVSSINRSRMFSTPAKTPGQGPTAPAAQRSPALLSPGLLNVSDDRENQLMVMKDMEIMKLENELASTRSAHDKLANEIDLVKEDQDRTNSELEFANSTNLALRQQLDEANRHLNVVSEQLNRAKNDLECSTQDKSDYVAQLQEKKDSLELELRVARTECDDSNRILMELREYNVALEIKLAELSASFSDACQQMSDFTTEKTALTEALTYERKQREMLEGETSAKDDKITMLENDVNNLNDVIKEQTDRMADLTDQLMISDQALTLAQAKPSSTDVCVNTSIDVVDAYVHAVNECIDATTSMEITYENIEIQACTECIDCCVGGDDDVICHTDECTMTDVEPVCDVALSMSAIGSSSSRHEYDAFEHDEFRSSARSVEEIVSGIAQLESGGDGDGDELEAKLRAAECQLSALHQHQVQQISELNALEDRWGLVIEGIIAGSKDSSMYAASKSCSVNDATRQSECQVDQLTHELLIEKEKHACTVLVLSDDHEKQIQTLTKTIEDLRSQIELKDNELIAYETKVSDLKTRVSYFEEALDISRITDKETSFLEVQVPEDKAKEGLAMTLIAALKAKVSRLEAELKDARSHGAGDDDDVIITKTNNDGLDDSVMMKQRIDVAVERVDEIKKEKEIMMNDVTHQNSGAKQEDLEQQVALLNLNMTKVRVALRKAYDTQLKLAEYNVKLEMELKRCIRVKNDWKVEAERCLNLERRARAELDNVRKETNSQIDAYRIQVDELASENAQAMGHHNLAQKIHYTERIKQENVRMAMELEKKDRIINRLQQTKPDVDSQKDIRLATENSPNNLKDRLNSPPSANLIGSPSTTFTLTGADHHSVSKPLSGSQMPINMLRPINMKGLSSTFAFSTQPKKAMK